MLFEVFLIICSLSVMLFEFVLSLNKNLRKNLIFFDFFINEHSNALLNELTSTGELPSLTITKSLSDVAKY